MEIKDIQNKKEAVLSLMRHPAYRPMKLKELAVMLDVPRERREELAQVLQLLIGEGKIGLSKRGKYGRPEDTALTGTFTATPQGYGFVTVEGVSEDYYVHESCTMNAFHGDIVRIAVTGDGAGGCRPEARVLQIVEHTVTEVIGVYKKSKNFGFVVPDNRRIPCDIFIPEGKDGGAESGCKVCARLDSYGSEHKSPEGHVTEIIGMGGDPGVDVTCVVRAYGIKEEFSPESLAQADAIPPEVEERLLAGRRDFRQVPMVTIDGEDAKDLDDAVSLTVTEHGFRLGVHIADVSEYVPESSALDKEALERGTSVYLADRVIPMLPRKLSNGICSLNAGCDRLALSCLMDFDENGVLTGHEICESVICVDKRLTYTRVQQLFEAADRQEPATEEKELPEELSEELCDMLLQMRSLAQRLRANRRKRGSIDFDMPETKVQLDERGRVANIYPYEHNEATNLIEDFMLIANETVAEDYYWQNIPFVYRVHEKPDEEKMQELSALLRTMGVRTKKHQGEMRSKDLQLLLVGIADLPESDFVNRLALRSMKQARYSEACSPHFGLAAPYYCHFTSPIRRYPDLQIHRIIKENLRGLLSAERQESYHAHLPETASHCSRMERRATEAERTVVRMKMAEYMSRRVGRTYAGIISSVTKWGAYVQLSNTVEGLIHVRSLADDYYSFDEKNHTLCGERTGRTLHLGDAVRVTVAEVDLGAHTIDFHLRGKE